MEESRAAVRALSGQRAKLFASAEVAEERSAAAWGRLPDLEAGKKAAASSRVSTLTAVRTWTGSSAGDVVTDIFIKGSTLPDQGTMTPQHLTCAA